MTGILDGLEPGLELGPRSSPRPDSSSPPLWKRFVLKSWCSSWSIVPRKGIKSVTLKMEWTPYSKGISNWYALSFIFLMIWKEPSPWGFSLDLRKWGNLSLRKCYQTKSPSLKILAFLPLLLYLACLWIWNWIWFCTFSCKSLMKLDLDPFFMNKVKRSWKRY